MDALNLTKTKSEMLCVDEMILELEKDLNKSANDPE